MASQDCVVLPWVQGNHSPLNQQELDCWAGTRLRAHQPGHSRAQSEAVQLSSSASIRIAKVLRHL